ncbi:MAG: hypothetical protein PHY93_00915 [Bacteriovorax sp.]|nr:hypothetical protein [Bacteriovorax sp.]
MKRLLIFPCLLTATFLKADELDSIVIITPTSYERASSSSQTIKSKVTVTIGDWINTDVSKEVKKKIAPYSKDLSNYFPKPGELDAFVDKVVSEGKNTIIGNNLSDEKLIRFYGHLGNNLIGGIADKILSTEGIKDPARRELWVKKILNPFQSCIGKSNNSQYDASRCMDALTTSLVPSAGIGLVYELSRSNLNSALPENQRASFDNNQVNIYKECIKKTLGGASDVKKCALQAMRSGVLKVTDLKLSKTITDASSSPAAAKSIEQAVWPGFTTCTQQVGTDKNSNTGLSEQFMGCIDNLVKTTGMQLVSDKLNTNASIKANFSKVELAKLTTDKVQSFKECIEDQQKNNIRKDGMLDTAKCETAITNDITYKVVAKTLVQTANDSFKSDHSAATTAGNRGKQLLDQCWSNDQIPKQRELCLRKTILSFSQVIASAKLDKAIPSDLKNKKELAQSSLKELASCLEKQLPANISEAHDLGAQTSVCSNQLTRKVALQVAKDSVRSKAIESKMSEADADKLVKTFVEQKFMNCIGTIPTDEKLENCSGELKKNVAVTLASSLIRANATGKVSPAETEVLITKLVTQKFSGCIGTNPSNGKLNDCIGELTKGATKSIVLSYEKKQIKDQLNTESTPTKLKPVEDNFVACVDRPYPTAEVSKSLGECTKEFALEFARNLGNLKLNSLMKSVLGLNYYNDQKKDIDQILNKYNECLDDLKKFDLEDGLLDKLTICTDGLERRGLSFVTGTVNTWMSSDEKDAATVMVKNEFANFIPCLGAFLPPSPYSQKLQANADSILKPISLIISQYIEYSPEDAKRTLDDIIKQLSTDLKDVASNPASRKALIDSLYNNGALDQLLKSMVRSEVKNAFDKMAESELPKDLRAALLTKENFDKIFASDEGKVIKDMVMVKILKPVLMDQVNMKSPLMLAGMDSVKDRVVKMLINSPQFGEQIIKISVQNKINDMGVFTHFIAKVLYGSNSLNWEKVRTSPDGKIAEAYIRENILLPKFKGQILSKADENNYNDEAEKLVKAAVKKYD